MSYVDEVLASVREKNTDQPEFIQAVTEVLEQRIRSSSAGVTPLCSRDWWSRTE